MGTESMGLCGRLCGSNGVMPVSTVTQQLGLTALHTGTSARALVSGNELKVLYEKLQYWELAIPKVTMAWQDGTAAKGACHLSLVT